MCQTAKVGLLTLVVVCGLVCLSCLLVVCSLVCSAQAFSYMDMNKVQPKSIGGRGLVLYAGIRLHANFI